MAKFSKTMSVERFSPERGSMISLVTPAKNSCWSSLSSQRSMFQRTSPKVRLIAVPSANGTLYCWNDTCAAAPESLRSWFVASSIV